MNREKTHLIVWCVACKTNFEILLFKDAKRTFTGWSKDFAKHPKETKLTLLKA